MQVFKKEDMAKEHYLGIPSACGVQEPHDWRRILGLTASLFCFVLLLIGISVIYNNTGKVYGIVVNDQLIAHLTSRQEAESAIAHAVDLRSKVRGFEVSFKDDIFIIEESRKDKKCFSIDQAAVALQGKVHDVVGACVIKVDGKEVAALANEKNALNVVELVKKHYIKPGDKVVDARFRENVEIIPQVCEPERLVSPNIALNRLLYGSDDKFSHKIESADETLWSIAKQYQVDVPQLQKANPGLSSQNLSVGMEIKLADCQPLVDVVIVKEIEKKAALPFAVKQLDNQDMNRGQEKVVQDGQYGQEEVVLQIAECNGERIGRQRVDSVITKAPTEKIVERGTKMQMASRSGGGGVLAWPIRGSITSYYGNRSLGYHTGVDIDGTIGEDVCVAESGTVVYTGYSGNYGNLVKVDHGGGLSTWYAHLNDIAVSNGDSLACGQLLGWVGSTGRSTGSHLHFEVRINGETCDPLSYLR